MLRDWSSPHLLDCGWDLDYPNENTLSLEFGIRDKHEPGFLQGVRALEKETPTKKRLEGGQEEGKEKKNSLHQRCKTRKMFPFNPREKQSLAWAWHLFKKF